ncbi:hypothetical protein [Streptomyces noursei]|uniref:hypothetical protein n=1 Tax=Streptomyces noursei TaxID=1971 RepID=UPI00167A30E7|nr:hypothetical protein [Streptomyces noursei]MCZ1017038.1 hypothetical protein [Streptomyces noursei]GGX10191.1 hypothetical protein GCM10010341_34560 [Streptomyces noursei]
MTPAAMPVLRPGYWCECWTQSPATGDAPALLASCQADNAVQAVRWIRVALRTITSALESEAAACARRWLAGGYVSAIEALAYTTPYEITVSHRDTHIQWTARPVLFVALAHREATELPACAVKFTPRPKAPTPY